MRSVTLFAALVCAALVPFRSTAQATLYGLTAAGGNYGVGTLYSVTETGTFTKKLDLFRNEGSNPKGDILLGANGKYYGTTEFGGASGLGTLWQYDPVTGIYTVLHEFTATTGSRPVRGVILTSNGRLTGTCSQGGANGFGCVFDYNTSTSVYSKRADFTGTTGTANGTFPRCRLVQVTSTRVFGVTQNGGVNNRGTIFEFNPTNGAITKRHDFAIGTGSNPYGGVLLASNGRLYGTTLSGGANNVGTLYEFNTTTNLHAKLVDLADATGSSPIGELMQATGGVIYGTTTAGGANTVGVIFSFTITGSVYAVVHHFDNLGGYSSFARMITGSDGFLYGTTNQGGPGADGVIFRFDRLTNNYTVLADLAASGIGQPWGGLMENANGILNGLCLTGGSGLAGGFFRYTIASSSLSVPVAFNYSSGAGPAGRMVRNTNGLFYGMANSGGSTNEGVVFSYDATLNAYTLLKSLGGTNGANPLGTFCEANGKYYGTCSEGGSLSGGTIIEYDPATNTLTKKIDLGTSTGTKPRTGFLKATNGKLYLLTDLGGANGLGTLVEYTPSTNGLVNRRDIAATDGTDPEAELMEANDGLLYGVMSKNGQFSFGTLFSYNTASNSFTKLYDFDGVQGGTPSGQLVQAPNGKLYGTCAESGFFDPGLIFSYNINNGNYNGVHDLLSTEGAASQSSLTLGTDGLLYGTCVEGGANNLGSVFRFNPTTNAVTVLNSFNGTTGQTPLDGLASGVIPAPANISVDIEVFLEGPFDGAGLMNDALRTLPTFPLAEPYAGLGFAHAGGGGGETVSASVLTATGNDAIVDWVFVQLRSNSDNTNVLYTRSALLQRDGDVVDVDGVSPLSFTAPAGNYFVSVRHRNHLGVLSFSAIALASSAVTVDFTDGTTATFGTDAQKIVGAYRVLWTGNVIYDTPLPYMLKYTGINNDRDAILVAVGGTIPTNTVNGYRAEDINLDGVTKYTGTANDRDPILVNVGGSIPTATRAEQLP